MRTVLFAREKPRPLPEPLAAPASADAGDPAIDAVEERAAGGKAAVEARDVGGGGGGEGCGVEDGGEGAGARILACFGMDRERLAYPEWCAVPLRHCWHAALPAYPALLVPYEITQAVHHRSLHLQ